MARVSDRSPIAAPYVSLSAKCAHSKSAVVALTVLQKSGALDPAPAFNIAALDCKPSDTVSGFLLTDITLVWDKRIVGGVVVNVLGMLRKIMAHQQ